MYNKEKAVEVNIDKEKCTKCGLCTNTCSSFLKKGDDGYPTNRENKDPENNLGCIQCGNCMMICPQNAIEIKGEDIDNSHLRALPTQIPSYEEFNALMQKRRSCRKFKKEEVSEDLINKILMSAATAAVSIPPSEVKVLVINGKDKVEELSEDLFKCLKKFMTFINPLTLYLVKLLAGKSQYKMFKDFIVPLSKVLIKNRKEGLDSLFYEAPCLILFYGTENTDKDDWLIASTQATLAAESLNLGTCYIGMAGAMFNDPNLRKKYGISKTDKVGTAFILGHPDIKFQRAFQRNFKEIRFIK